MADENRIKIERVRARLTQDELAQRAGITRSVLAQYEAGNNQPPLNKLKRLSAALRVPLVSLLETSVQEDFAGFGERLRKARLAAGLSGCDIERDLGISRQSISAWESGKSLPRSHKESEVIRRLERYLKCSNGHLQPVGSNDPQSNTQDPPKLISVEDASRVSGVSREDLAAMARGGTFTLVTLPVVGRQMLDAKRFYAWLESLGLAESASELEFCPRPTE